ncbi:MAG: tetratricopeptide repeat protein, partial [Deltaproteobacteria bacterium]
NLLCPLGLSVTSLYHQRTIQAALHSIFGAGPQLRDLVPPIRKLSGLDVIEMPLLVGVLGSTINRHSRCAKVSQRNRRNQSMNPIERWNELRARIAALYQQGSQGRYLEAAEVARAALKIAEDQVGTDHPNIAESKETRCTCQFDYNRPVTDQ